MAKDKRTSTPDIATEERAPQWLLTTIVWIGVPLIIAGIIVGVRSMTKNKPVRAAVAECGNGFLPLTTGTTLVQLPQACWTKVYWKPSDAESFYNNLLDGPVDVDLYVADGTIVHCKDQTPVSKACFAPRDANNNIVRTRGMRFFNRKDRPVVTQMNVK